MENNKIRIKKNADSGANNKGGLIDFIFKYDSLVIFGGLIVAILATIIFTGLFVAGPIIRDNLLYNAAGSMLMAFLFIYLILKFMAETIVIFGAKVDFGMILYISIIFFIMFMFSN